jgi:CDP-diacylglycerol---serine O-phosphatidyltransferase
MVTFKQAAPSILTLGSLFCGLLSATYSIAPATGDRSGLVIAAWLILAATLFDALDGKVSRLFKTSSRFGIELDSIADVCSFGFAPAILAYQFIRTTLGPSWGPAALGLSFLFLAFGALRLARFNVEIVGFDKSMFKGLPIPSAAGVVVAFVVFSDSPYVSVNIDPAFPWVLGICGLLMISSVRYDTFPRFAWDDTWNRAKLLMLATWAVTAMFYPKEAFLPLGLIYVTVGVARYVVDFVRRDALEESAESTDKGRL